MKALLTYLLPKLRLALMLFALAAGAIAVAAFTNPGGSPPTTNIAPPVVTGATAQAKASNFAAGALAGTFVLAANAFCFPGSDCVTEWWGGEVSFSSACRFERVGVFANANTDSPNNSGYRDYCPSQLSTAAREAGWVSVSSDACAEDRSTCTTDGISCVYARFVCDDVNFGRSSNLYSPNQAAQEGLYPTNSGGGGGDNNGGGSTNNNITDNE